MTMFDFKGWDVGKWGKQAPAAGPSLNGLFDAAVVGSGPAGTVMATLLAEKHGLRVCIIDPNLERRWLPNYGVWIEEWEALDRDLDIGLGDCLSRKWPITECFYGGSHGIPNDERLVIERPYARVGRDLMRDHLTKRMAKAGVARAAAGIDAESVVHEDLATSFRLSDGTPVRCRVLVDCTGHESKLIERSGPHDPGFQIAYGIECEVESTLGPYHENAMLFMDYRIDYATSPAEKEKYAKEPTFLYAMPLGTSETGKTRIFLEETSLVARPAMSFDECKDRLYKRLAHLGIKVTKVDEEEFCYIPMGGSLPKLDQRVISFGGAAGTVHASTGYMVSRMLASAGPVSRALGAALNSGPNVTPASVARATYRAMWPAGNLLQRDFQVFGGEFLMKQDVTSLRGFFNGFFKLPLPLWAGFLSGYSGLPHNELHQTWQDRLKFGLLFFLQVPVPVKLALMASGVLEGWQYGLIRCVTPLAGIQEAHQSSPVELEYAEQSAAQSPATAKPSPSRELLTR